MLCISRPCASRHENFKLAASRSAFTGPIATRTDILVTTRPAVFRLVASWPAFAGLFATRPAIFMLDNSGPAFSRLVASGFAVSRLVFSGPVVFRLVVSRPAVCSPIDSRPVEHVSRLAASRPTAGTGHFLIARPASYMYSTSILFIPPT